MTCLQHIHLFFISNPIFENRARVAYFWAQIGPKVALKVAFFPKIGDFEKIFMDISIEFRENAHFQSY